MSLRELTPAESAQVSGALGFGSYLESMPTDLDRNFAIFEWMGNLWAATTPKYAGKDWHYVVAVEPDLNRGMSSFLDGLGVSGKNTLKMWAHDYA